MLELAARLLGLLDGSSRDSSAVSPPASSLVAAPGSPSASRLAAATAVDVVGSSPHPIGSSMVVSAAGDIVGTVSGGCVEGAALRGCRDVLGGGGPFLARYGWGERADGAGLSCGGELDVLVHPVGGEATRAELAAAAAGRSAVLGLVISGPVALLGSVVAGGEGAGLAGEAALGAELAGARAAVMAQGLGGASGVVDVGCDGLRLLVEVRTPAARLVIVGATETAAALTAAAAALGYAVTVVDARSDLTIPSRFPAAGEVVAALPHEYLATTRLDARSVVCVLSHDDDLDPLALAVALRGPAGYVGALGSRATAGRREERLRILDVPDTAIARLHAPIGLDLGASSPAETAVSILAEVLAARTGRSTESLRVGEGAIHG